MLLSLSSLSSNVHLPGNTMSIARQFIRCTLHQLLSNGIFRQIFQSHSSDVILFRAIAVALADFAELNQVSPLKELFEVSQVCFHFQILHGSKFSAFTNVLITKQNCFFLLPYRDWSRRKHYRVFKQFFKLYQTLQHIWSVFLLITIPSRELDHQMVYHTPTLRREYRRRFVHF